MLGAKRRKLCLWKWNHKWQTYFRYGRKTTKNVNLIISIPLCTC